MTTKTFHIGDILSVTTGFLVSPGHMSGVHELLEFMAGGPVWTHQLPRVSDESKPALLAQHPDLADADVPESFNGKEHVDRWLVEQVARFGETREVAALAAGDHAVIDPITEFQMIRPDLPVVVIETGGQS